MWYHIDQEIFVCKIFRVINSVSRVLIFFASLHMQILHMIKLSFPPMVLTDRNATLTVVLSQAPPAHYFTNSPTARHCPRNLTKTGGCSSRAGCVANHGSFSYTTSTAASNTSTSNAATTSTTTIAATKSATYRQH